MTLEVPDLGWVTADTHEPGDVSIGEFDVPATYTDAEPVLGSQCA